MIILNVVPQRLFGVRRDAGLEISKRFFEAFTESDLGLPAK